MSEFDTTTGGMQHTGEEPVVRVTQLSGDVVSLDYEPGTSLGDYLSRAEIEVARGQVVTVNGQPARDMNAPLEPDSVVVVVGKIANGR